MSEQPEKKAEDYGSRMAVGIAVGVAIGAGMGAVMGGKLQQDRGKG